MLNTILSILAGLVILDKVIILVCNLDGKSWTGHRLRFGLLTLSLGAIVAGAAGVIFNISWGGYVLLYGMAGRFLCDRRLLEVNRKMMPRKRKILS